MVHPDEIVALVTRSSTEQPVRASEPVRVKEPTWRTLAAIILVTTIGCMLLMVTIVMIVNLARPVRPSSDDVLWGIRGFWGSQNNNLATLVIGFSAALVGAVGATAGTYFVAFKTAREIQNFTSALEEQNRAFSAELGRRELHSRLLEEASREILGRFVVLERCTYAHENAARKGLDPEVGARDAQVALVGANWDLTRLAAGLPAGALRSEIVDFRHALVHVADHATFVMQDRDLASVEGREASPRPFPWLGIRSLFVQLLYLSESLLARAVSVRQDLQQVTLPFGPDEADLDPRRVYMDEVLWSPGA